MSEGVCQRFQLGVDTMQNVWFTLSFETLNRYTYV